MKIAVDCHSPLLTQSLEKFLRGRLSSQKHCDLVICDHKIENPKHTTIFISSSSDADLRKPFSKEQLFETINKALSSIKPIETAIEENSSNLDFSILERHIAMLTQEYQANIIHAIKSFYEK